MVAWRRRSASSSPSNHLSADGPGSRLIPVPPRLEMKNGPNPTTWGVWAQRWKAFAAVSRLDAQSDAEDVACSRQLSMTRHFVLLTHCPMRLNRTEKSRTRSSTCSENTVYRTKTLCSNATSSTNDGKRKVKPSNTSLQTCVRWSGLVTLPKTGRTSIRKSDDQRSPRLRYEKRRDQAEAVGKRKPVSVNVHKGMPHGRGDANTSDGPEMRTMLAATGRVKLEVRTQ